MRLDRRTLVRSPARRFRFSDFRFGAIDGARAVELFAATGSTRFAAGAIEPEWVEHGACSLSDISGWRDRSLYPLARGRRAARQIKGLTRWRREFLFRKIGCGRTGRRRSAVAAD